MQGRPGQFRNGRLQGIEAVVERQQRMLAEGDDDSLFLGRQDCRARSFRPHGNVVDEGPFAPLGDCLVVQPILCRKLFERSLRSLYRSSDGVRGRGAAMKYLAHSASRNAGSVCLIPSHSGTEHLALLGLSGRVALGKMAAPPRAGSVLLPMPRIRVALSHSRVTRFTQRPW